MGSLSHLWQPGRYQIHNSMLPCTKEKDDQKMCFSGVSFILFKAILYSYKYKLVKLVGIYVFMWCGVLANFYGSCKFCFRLVLTLVDPRSLSIRHSCQPIQLPFSLNFKSTLPLSLVLIFKESLLDLKPVTIIQLRINSNTFHITQCMFSLTSMIHV